MNKKIAIVTLMLSMGSFASADVSEKAGEMIDKTATGTKGGTESGANKVNQAITEKAGDNKATQAATKKVTAGSHHAKKKTDHGAAKVKEVIGAATPAPVQTPSTEAVK